MNPLCIIAIIMAWIFSACGDMSNQPPERRVASVKKSDDASRSDAASSDDTDDKVDETDDNGDNSDNNEKDNAKDEKSDKDDSKKEKEEEKDIEVEGMPLDTETKATTVKETEERSAANVNSLRREDDSLMLYIKAGKDDFKSIPWPKRGDASELAAICIKGKVTEIELEVNDPERGRIKANNVDIGQRSSGSDFIEIGYESQGGCNGKGCQDDNILKITCKDGIKVKGLD